MLNKQWSENLSAGIPLNPEDVTAEWLSKALSTTEAVTQVRSVEHQSLIRGAGTKLRMALNYDSNPRNLPTTLWIKVGWEDHSKLMEDMGVYAREAIFFSDFAPILKVRAPICYWVENDSNGRSGIILEDLHERGAELWTCTEPRSPDDVGSLLNGLAHMHAKFWEDATLSTMPNIDILVDPTGPSAEWSRQSGGEHLRQIIEGPRGKLMPSYTRSAERIEKAYWRMVETLDRRNGRCLLHCDPHPGNCFSDADGSAGLYDWQTITRGPWAFDISYAMTTALSLEDRRRHESDLLAQYLATLTDLGVQTVPNMDDAWDDYCRYIAYPLLIWPTNRPSHQAEENVRALTERLAVAAADFKFFERWGA